MTSPTLPALPGVRLTPTSLVLTDTSPAALRSLGASLADLDTSLQWWWGDWLRAWLAVDEGAYAEAERISGRSYQTLRNFVWVAGQFLPVSRRRDRLPWWHHAECASLEPAEADQLLDIAEREGWSGRQVRDAVRKIRGDSPKAAIDVPVLNQMIAAQVHQIRELAGVSQADMAEEIYGTRSQQATISRLERGVQRPNLGTIARLSEWSGAPVESFGLPTHPMLPARLVQRHAQAALSALERGETKRLRAILERLATAVVEGDL